MGETTVRLWGGSISVNGFQMLGVRPILGRIFGDSDATNSDTAVISYDAWQRIFQSDVKVIGRTFELEAPDRGGGFSTQSENSLLDDFVLSLSRHQPARVCFLPTASSDSSDYIVKFYRAFAHRCLASDLTLSGSIPRSPARTADLASFLARQDVIYVGVGIQPICSRYGERTASTACSVVRGRMESCSLVSAPGCCAGSPVG